MIADERLGGRKRQRQRDRSDNKSNASAFSNTNCHKKMVSSTNTSMLVATIDAHNKTTISSRNILVLALTLFIAAISSCHAKEDKNGCDKCLVDPMKAHWNPAAAKAKYVVHVVADGLRPDHMLDYPNFAYLKSHGVGTGNARNQLLSSQTLPNHISMFTGLSVSEHGHIEDGDSKEKLTSFVNIFDLVKAVGGTNAFYGAKEKFETFQKQWQIDNYVFTKWAHRVMNTTGKMI